MLRVLVLVLPAFAVAVSLLAMALPTRPGLVLTLATLGGLVTAGLVFSVGERRLGQAADRLQQFIRGGQQTALDPQGSRQWQRLVDALDAVSATLKERFAELADERARVERLLDNLPTAILLFTEDGLAYSNPAARELFAIGREPGARTPLQVLAVEGLADAVAETRETGRPVQVEVKRADRDLAARASVTSAGEVALAVADLTEARRVESIRRDFVTNASHELKTPVAGIQALAESLSLAVERDPDRAQRMIERIQHEAGRLGHMVRDLLDLARLEDMTSPQGRRRVDVGATARAQTDRLAGLADEHDIKVNCDVPDEAVVIAIPEDIRLIVGNLLENAIRYNRAGGEINVTVRPQQASVLLEVSDTGIGIPETDQDRIFERFYRVDKARSRAAGGTGLGLALVRHATERQGGSISVRSVLGEGSTFRVVLPIEGRQT